MKQFKLFLLAALALPSLSTMAVERATITSPDQLKPGQCAYASEVYEPGEPIVERVKGVAQVCANINGKGVALTITKDSMDLLGDKPTVTFRTVEVAGIKLQLADTTFSERGVTISCKQYVRGMYEEADLKTIDIEKVCAPVSSTPASVGGVPDAAQRTQLKPNVSVTQ